MATLTTREPAGLWHLVQAADDVALIERTTARRFLPLPETVADGARLGVAEDGVAHTAAYHRYRVSARAARDYDGFPTILVVTHGPRAENRVADAVLATDGGQSTPLGVLLTTAELLAHVAGGLFGPIWRTPGHAARACSWPPSGLTVREA